MKTKSSSHKPNTFIAIVIFLCLKVSLLGAQCPTVTNPNQTFCDLESLLIGDLQAQDNGNGIVWYETATSTFPLPNNFPLTSGAVYFADDNSGSCGSRQSVTVTIFGPPSGQNFQGFCIDDSQTVTLNDLNVNGNDVQWYATPFGGSPIPVTTVLTDGVTYYADQANPVTGCRTSRLAVFVTVGIVPTPSGDSIQEFCLSPGNVPTVSDLEANGVNNWYPSLFSNLPIPPNTPLVSGQIYYATSVDPPCESIGRLAVLAVVNEVPNAGSNGTLDICTSSGSVDLFNFLGNSPDSGGTWSPALTSGTGIFDPTVDNAGVYTYTVVGSNPCPNDSASISVQVFDQPDAGEDASLEICSSDSSSYDLFSLLGGTPEAGGTWNPTLASGTNIFNPELDPAGIYTYTVGSTLPCPDDATVTISIVPESNAGGNGTLEICASDSPVDLFESLIGSPETGGLWTPTLSSGSGVFDPSLDGAGVYTYTVSGSGPCPDVSATVTVGITTEPNAGSNGVLDLCSSDDSIDLFTALGGNPDPGGSWSPVLNSGSGLFDPSIDMAGTYTYTVLGTGPCPNASSTVTVSVSNQPDAGINGNINVCVSDSPIDLFGSLGGTPDTGGTWSPALNSGTGIFDPSIDPEGIYTYTVLGTGPCLDATSTVTVSLIPEPNAGIDGSIELCISGSSVDLFTVLGGNPETGGSWSPTLASGTGVFDPGLDSPGIYTYTVLGVDPCPDASATVLVTTIIDPNAGTDGTIELCSSDSPVDLFASLGGNPDAGGTWTPALASGTGLFDPALDSPGVYTYTVAGTSPCPDATANVTVTVIAQPNAGTDATLDTCSSEDPIDLFSLLGGSPDSGGSWSPVLTSGTGVFDPSVDSAGVYTYTVLGTASCPDASAAVTVSLATQPNAGTNGVLEICASDSPIDLFSSLGGSPDTGGTWSPALASGTGVFDPSVDSAGVYTYTVLGTSPCPDASATVTVSFLANANAGEDASLDLCASENPVDLFTSLGGTPDAGGTWSPALASGTGVFDPSLDSEGVYTYTVGTLCIDTATVTVNINPEANPGLDGNLIVCDLNITYDLFLSLGGNPDTGGTWSPALSSGTGVFDPSIDSPGSYTYTVTGVAGCPDASAQVNVTFTVLPNAGDDGTLNLCVNETPVDLFSILGGNPETGGSWSPTLASGTGVFDPGLDSPGIYTYTVGPDNCGNTDTAEVAVQLNPLPNAGTDGTIELCSSDSPVDLFASLGGNPDAGGTWTPALASGTGLFDPALDSPGVYTYTVAGTSPCPDATANVTVTVIAQPNAGTDATLDTCSSEDPIDLFSLLGGSPDSGGSWSPVLTSGTGVFDPSVDSAGVYTYTVLGTASCPDASAAVTVSLATQPNAGTNGVLEICASDSPIDLFSSLGGSPDTGGTWSPALASGTGVFDPSVDSAGVYTYTVLGTSPCPDASATVTVSFLANANAGEDASLDLCASENPVDLFTSLGGTPDAGGTWSPALASGTGVFDPSLDSEGVYTYTVGTLCIDTATVTVNINPEANPGLDGNLIVCDLNITYDLFLSLGGNPDTGGTWSPALSSGTGVFDPSIDSPGSYTYTVTGVAGCPDASAQVNVTFTVLPNAGDDGTLNLCVNETPVDLFSILGGNPETGGSWSPTLASGTGVFDPGLDSPGIYTYTVGPDNCGNTDTAEVAVQLNPLPNAGTDGTIELCSSDSPVDLFASLGGNPDAGGPGHLPLPVVLACLTLLWTVQGSIRIRLVQMTVEIPHKVR